MDKIIKLNFLLEEEKKDFPPTIKIVKLQKGS